MHEIINKSKCRRCICHKYFHNGSVLLCLGMPIKIQKDDIFSISFTFSYLLWGEVKDCTKTWWNFLSKQKRHHFLFKGVTKVLSLRHDVSQNLISHSLTQKIKLLGDLSNPMFWQTYQFWCNYGLMHWMDPELTTTTFYIRCIKYGDFV